MKKRDIPKDILESIENELLVDERLLWVGLPGKQAAAIDMAMKATMVGLLGMMMLGMMAFFLVSSDSSSSAITPIIPAILILVGFGVVIARIRQNQAQADLYAITNRRAVILRKKSVQSFSSEDLRFIERKMHNNGTGDIIFNREYYQRTTMMGTTPMRSRESQAIGFFGIENPSEVEALMLETFRSKEPEKRRLMDKESDELYDDYEDDFQHIEQS